MTMPPQHNPGNELPRGIVEPRMRPTVIGPVEPAADLNPFVRRAATADLPHTVSAMHPGRARTDGVRPDPVNAVLRFPASIQEQASR